MKTFKLLFKVGPAGMFGLPQDGMVVVGGTTGRSFVGPTLDSRSGEFVSHGSLSQYRPDDEAVRFAGPIGNRMLTVRDNFFNLTLQADDRRHALRDGTVLEVLNLLRRAVLEDFEVVGLQVLHWDAVPRGEGVHADQVGASAKSRRLLCRGG